MTVFLVAWMPIAGGAELTLAPEGGRVRVSVGALGEFTVGAPRLLEAGTLELAGSGASFLVVAEGEREAGRMANRLSAALGIPCHAVHSMPAWNGSILPLISGRGHP